MAVSAVQRSHRDLAWWLLTQELGDDERAAAYADAAERACQKLGARLSRLVTFAGWQALLARALHLARAGIPVLDGVRPGHTPDVGLDGLHARLDGAEPTHACEIVTTLLTAVITLLATFIGDELTSRFVGDVWPDAPAAASIASGEGRET